MCTGNGRPHRKSGCASSGKECDSPIIHIFTGNAHSSHRSVDECIACYHLLAVQTQI